MALDILLTSSLITQIFIKVDGGKWIKKLIKRALPVSF